MMEKGIRSQMQPFLKIMVQQL